MDKIFNTRPMNKMLKTIQKADKEFLEDKINETERLHLTELDEDLIKEFENLSKEGYEKVNEYKTRYFKTLSDNISEYK